MPSLPFSIPRVRRFLTVWRLSTGVKMIGFFEIFLGWCFLVLHASYAIVLIIDFKIVDWMERPETYKTSLHRDLGFIAWLLVSAVDVASIVIAVCLIYGAFYEDLCLVESWVRIKCFLVFAPLITVVILVFFEDYLTVIISYALTTAMYFYFIVVVNSFAYHLELGDLDQLSDQSDD